MADLDSADHPLPLTALLPLRALAVTLTFTAAARFGPFHQAAVYGFLRHLLEPLPGFANLLTLDTPESGRTAWRAGDRYRAWRPGRPA